MHSLRNYQGNAIKFLIRITVAHSFKTDFKRLPTPSINEDVKLLGLSFKADEEKKIAQVYIRLVCSYHILFYSSVFSQGKGKLMLIKNKPLIIAKNWKLLNYSSGGG